MLVKYVSTNSLCMKTSLYFLALLLLPFSAFTQWEQTNGPFGAWQINHITATDSGLMFVSAIGAGIFRSNDFGDNWTNVMEANAVFHISALHITSDGILFASDSGIVRSIDNGNSWQLVGLPDQYVGAIESDTSGLIYAGTFVVSGTEQAGIYKSDDNGDTWEQVFVVDGVAEAVTLHVTDDGTVWYGGSSQVWRSDDNGITWTDVSLPLGGYNVTGIDTDSEGTVYLTSNYMIGAWKSTDNGISWIDIIPPSDIGEMRAVAVDDDDEVFVAVNAGVVRSSDGGETWDTIFLNDITMDIVYSIESINSDSLFIGSQGLLMSTDNGDNWQFRNQGLVASHIKSLAVSPQGNVFAISLNLWMSADDGETWSDIGAHLEANDFQFIKSHSTGLYLHATIDWAGVLLRSVDEGVTWVEIASYVDDGFNIYDVQINSQGDLFILSYDGIYRSTDNGATWQLLDIEADQDIKRFTIGSNDAIMAYYLYNIELSLDNGDTWSVVESPEEVVSLLEADNNGNFYYVSGFTPTIMFSDDNGSSWANISPAGVSSTPVGLYIHHNGDLYLTTDNSVYHTADGGDNWTDFYSEMVTPQAYFIELDSDPSSPFMFGAHFTTGVWRSGINVDIDAPDANDFDAFLTASPNPAKGSVTIICNDITLQNTILTLYNQSGSVVRKVKLTGSQAIISLQGLSQGLYIVKTEDEKSLKLVVK